MKKIVFYFVLFIVPFFVMEGIVRLVHYHMYPLFEDKSLVYTGHPVFHHWHKPDSSSTNVALSGEFSVKVTTNQFGMAGKPVAQKKPEGTFRVAVLGDSFAEGFTTDEDNRIVNLLEKQLKTKLSDRYEVLNFGCGTFSPSLQYFQLTNLVSKFEPDLIVLLFHATDVPDDWNYQQGNVVDANGEVIRIDGTENKGIIYQIAERSALLSVVFQRIKVLKKTSATKESQNLTNSYGALFKETYDENDLAAWDVTKSYLQKINEWSIDNAVPFVLVPIPLGQQVEVMEPDERYLGTQLTSGEVISSTRMQDVLEEWAAGHQVSYLDLLPAAKDYKEENPTTPLYYPKDQHFAAEGNRVAADAIYSHLMNNNLIEPLH